MSRPHKKRPSQKTAKRSAKKVAAAPAGQQRLQRLLASAGFGSRRQCEELVESGRVEVDGQNITKLGTTVDPRVNKILVDGVPLRKQKLVYYAVNKPVGYVTTNADPQGRARVIELVPKSERVFPVGRLDRNSEGLILLTNDGDLAQQLSHPKFGVQKIYRVTVAGKVDGETMKQMRHGIYIAEGHVHVQGARILKTRSKSTELEIVLQEGKNREIRRILARLGHKVQHLRRIAVGPLRLGDLPSGAYRPLKHPEVQKLQALVNESTLGKGTGTDRGEQGQRKQGQRKQGQRKQGQRKRAPKKPTGSRPDKVRGTDKSVRKTSSARSTKVLDRPSRGSAVIGGDASSTDELKPNKKKRSAKKGGGKRGGVKKSARSRSTSSGRGSSAGLRKNEPSSSQQETIHEETKTIVSTMSELHAHFYADGLVQADAKIEQQELIGEETYRLRVAVPEIAAAVVPGHFVMIRLAGTDAPLIGRALAVYDVVRDDQGQPRWIDLVYIRKGTMTTALAGTPLGTEVTLWGPLGNGFDHRCCDRLIMAAGGIGQTPMLLLGREALGSEQYAGRANGWAKNVELIYGARRASLLAGVDDFQTAGFDVTLCTDDGSEGEAKRVPQVLGERLETLPAGESIRVATCGPEIMMEKIAEMCIERSIDCQVSMETPMACGIGICFSCVAKVREEGPEQWDYKRTCVEGPIFDADKLVW